MSVLELETDGGDHHIKGPWVSEGPTQLVKATIGVNIRYGNSYFEPQWWP